MWDGAVCDTAVELLDLMSDLLPGACPLGVIERRLAERFTMHSLPDGKRPIDEDVRVIERQEAWRPNTCVVGGGRRDGFGVRIGHRIGMVRRHTQDDVIGRVDAIGESRCLHCHPCPRNAVGCQNGTDRINGFCFGLH